MLAQQTTARKPARKIPRTSQNFPVSFFGNIRNIASVHLSLVIQLLCIFLCNLKNWRRIQTLKNVGFGITPIAPISFFSIELMRADFVVAMKPAGHICFPYLWVEMFDQLPSGICRRISWARANRSRISGNRVRMNRCNSSASISRSSALSKCPCAA